MRNFVDKGSCYEMSCYTVIAMTPQHCIFWWYAFQIFIRGCTLVPPLALAIFGRPFISSSSTASNAYSITIAGWITFSTDYTSGLAISRLRIALDCIVHKWLSGQVLTLQELKVIDACSTAFLEASKDSVTTWQDLERSSLDLNTGVDDD